MSERDLIASIVVQAQDDIRNAQLESTDYTQAVAFFIGGGAWSNSRADIADLLGVEPSILSAFGRRIINERRATEGLTPLPAAEAQPATPIVLPRLIAIPAQPRKRVARAPRPNPLLPHGIFTEDKRAA